MSGTQNRLAPGEFDPTDPDSVRAAVKNAVSSWMNGPMPGMVMGATAPVAPGLTSAMRVGNQVVTGANHQILERLYPEMAAHPQSELGYINPVGKWLPRPAAFQYAMQNDLIAPNRAAEANRFYKAMDEAGQTNKLFLPSEWLKSQ